MLRTRLFVVVAILFGSLIITIPTAYMHAALPFFNSGPIAATDNSTLYRNSTISSEFDSPPVANNDAYTRHGSGVIGSVLQNDNDPDGDSMSASIVTFPSHGSLSGLNPGSWFYSLSVSTYTGTDSFTYKACALNVCSAPATVTITIVNQAPTAVNDSYTVHGSAVIGPMMVNDFDPDGDTLSWSFVSPPSHGSLFGVPVPPNTPDMKRFDAANPYTGPDSFTYKVCDSLGLCSSPATVNINIVNNPPTPGPDEYTVRGTTIIGPFKVNDTDPDGDTLGGASLITGASHGTVFGLSTPPYAPDQKQYVPNAGYSGSDSFAYRVCDSLGKCTDQTVTLHVEGDGTGLGTCPAPGPGRGPKAIAKPVDVTNGNMYLQQNDYMVPGVGYMLLLERTYNSKSSLTGVFGKGWSTAYDEALQVYDSNTIRLNAPDGRSTYFGRIIGSSGAFLPLEGDFRGQLTQTAGGYTLSLKDGSNHQFDSTGRLLSLTDRNGNQTTLAYNLSGKLSSVTDPFGRLLSFIFNGDRVSQITDTTGVIADYTYSNVTGSNQKLLTVTYADTSGYTFVYDASHRLTTVKDKLNNVLEAHAYDSQGRATSSEVQGGVEHYTLSYVSGTETDVTDALGHVTKYFFNTSNARNVVTSVEGVCSCGGSGSQLTTWAYDNNVNVTSMTDALSHTISYTYDTAGNLLTITNPTGTVTYTYNTFGQVLTYTDQMGGVTTNTYNATGDLLTTKDALNNTTTFTYDTRGQLLTVTDARNKVTTFIWDSSGRVTQVLDALSNTTNFAYDLRAHRTSVTNALNNTTSYQYDAAGRLKKVIAPDTTFVQYTYDLAGRGTNVTDPRGNETNFVYDGAYRLTSVTDALNHTTSYTYDLMSNLTSITDALARVTDFEYDDFNRLKKTIYPPASPGATRLQETITYNTVGDIAKRTDTAGRDTTYVYDTANRLTSTTDPALQVTQFQYNARSQPTTITDALNQQYSFVYDALGRVTQAIRGGLSMSYSYDAVGNQTQRTDYNGANITFVYDDLNRVTAINYPDSTSATYTYDALSRLTAGTNPNGTVTFGYNSLNRLTSTTDVWGQTVGYSYDANGNRTALTVSGAPYATYQFDAVDRLTNIADSASQNFVYNYDVVNRLTSRTAPNGVTLSFTYDGMGRLTELAHTQAPATLSINQYAYNGANSISSWLGSSGNRSLNYDTADRLLGVSQIGGNESYGYDGVGNRTSSHLSATYGYQAVNKLSSTTSATYTYNNNGNMLSRTDGSGTKNFSWDSENQLKQVTLPGGLSVDYKYDALGRRIQRTTSAGADERFVYDGQDVVEDLDSSLTVTTSYLNGLGSDDHLRQTNTTSGVSYFLTDHLGSTSALTDSSGTVVETINNDAFGNSAGSTRTRYTYTGRESDPDTGLFYYRARFYDPELGRFISEDPIGLSGGLNLYRYVSQDPVNKRDPSGLYEIDVHYYLTYYLARKTGCFTDEQARMIAEFDQLTDDDPDHAPGFGRSQNVDFHAFGTHAQNDLRRQQLFDQAVAGLGSLSNLGIFFHFLQDSYSHYDYAGNRNVGQATGLFAVDHTNTDTVKAMQMARSSWFWLNQFAKKKNPCCRPEEPDWQIVYKFVMVGYDLSTVGGQYDNNRHEISNEQLRRKIEILGVPWRSPNGRSRP
jgi:RHS repeat-associated protein